MTIDEAITRAKEKTKEKRKEMQCKTCKLFDKSLLHPLQGYCRKNEFRSIEIDSWGKVCSEYVPKEMCKCAEEHEQLVEWLEDYKRIKQWKSDIMDSFCKYDVSSFEELVTNVRNKTIDDFVKLVKKHDWNIRNRNENAFIYGAIDKLAEQLKEQNK